jgi:uncharacterized membrane protein (UPF0127 family)
MKVYNKKKLIAEVGLLESNAEISRGLRFSKRLGKEKGLLLKWGYESRFHTIVDMFFVFYPIDVIWLDRNFKVVDVKENMLPFTFKIPRIKAMYVLEIEKGSSKGIKIGDILKVRKS